MAQEMMGMAPGSSAGGGNGGPVAGRPPTSLAPGFRFHPTDEELVRYYLWRKVCGKPFRFQAVVEIDVYKSEPWELSAFSPLKSRDMEWYFFSPVDRKYGNGSRLNRATQQGYWKATGKDRFVRHKSQTIGMKKTLVFHGGRAPDGKRTNWVMHEYRLVEEQFENAFVVQDAFVLCRIFQKSGLGPPNGDRYAPFREEEWENDAALYIPGGEADDDMPNGDEPRIGFINEQDLQDKQKAPLFREDSFDPQSQSIDFLSMRREGSDDWGFLSLGPSKRSKQDDPNSSNGNGNGNGNGSEDSTTTSQGPLTNISSAALEFPLQLPKQKESQPTNLLDSSNLEKSVPPGFLKFINNLENDILNGSVEKENLKLELRRAESMINTLQTRIEFLSMENEHLRSVVSGSG